MTLLPLEILVLTSQYLDAKDLTQLQLVNKKWHEASIESLYSDVCLIRDDQAIAYIRTISNSSKHALFLKSINASRLSSIGIYNLFDSLVEHCPNFQRINSFSQHRELWARLMQASTEGKFLNFRELPLTSKKDISVYTSTALCFKKSLDTLTLADHIGPESDFENVNTAAFLKLRHRIKEFSNLKKLIVYHHTNQPFSHLDTLIEDCSHLKVLKVTFYRCNSLGPAIQQNILAKPRPDISRLDCAWHSICEDDQLKYIMRKFPNIQHLEINTGCILDDITVYNTERTTSYKVTIEFIQYLSRIPMLNIAMVFKKEYLLKYWNEFTKLKLRDISFVRIVFKKKIDVDHIVMIHSEAFLELMFSVNPTDTSLLHEDFFHEHGNMIKDLDLDDAGYACDFANNGPASLLLQNENWIYKILQSCPSLETLSLNNFVDLVFPVTEPYRHTNLKLLTIHNEIRHTSLKFLRNFSAYVPNLKELYITCFVFCSDETNDDHFEIFHRIIDMPFTFFDDITWIFFYDPNDLSEYYIKLTTITDTKYYVADEDGAHELTYFDYLTSTKNVLFDITCSGLNRFNFKLWDDIIPKFTSVCEFQE